MLVFVIFDLVLSFGVRQLPHCKTN